MTTNFDRWMHFVLARRHFVLIFTLLLALWGALQWRHLSVDAVPDITNVQVQVNTSLPGATPLQMEQRVTFALENVLAGLPGLESTRSVSRYGLSQITVVFAEGTDPYFARQLITERLSEAKEQLPQGAQTSLGPIATGLGEIYSWSLSVDSGAVQKDGSPYLASDLRDLQDWVVKPQLRTLKGVTEVNTIGGYEREIHIIADPRKLQSYGLTYSELAQAISQNQGDQGAGFVEKSGMQHLVRVRGQIQDTAELRWIPLKSSQGAVVRLGDVAEIVEGSPLRSGAATMDGREVVLGTVFMLLGENSREVAARVDARMQEIARQMPPGVKLETVYNRMHLVDQVMGTVAKSLVEGALLVIAVLFVFLGNLRAALIAAAIIPLAMLMTFSGMVSVGVSASLMSLGALDFGILVDGAVVIVERCLHGLRTRQQELGRVLDLKERLHVVYQSSKEVRKPLIYGQLIIISVYLPLFALQGVEGKMFHPMAATVVMALTAAMVLTLSFIPAALALWLKSAPATSNPRWLAALARAYTGLLHRALARRAQVVALALIALVLGGLAASRLGSEFVPSLDEGDVALHAMRTPGTSLTQSVQMQEALESALRQHPEVERVFAKIGSPEIATDPMPPHVADVYLILKPRQEWPNPDLSKGALVEQLQATAAQIPGNNYEFTQPIQMRFNELISGVRTDVAVKVFGEDMDVMFETAEAIAQTLKGIPGAADVKVEQVTDVPLSELVPNRSEMSMLGVTLQDLQKEYLTAQGREVAGLWYQGARPRSLVVKMPDSLRRDSTAQQQIPVLASQGVGQGPLLLGQVATLEQTQSPSQISRENGKRRIVVTANVRGRDLGGFVGEAKERIAAEVRLGEGIWLRYGGTFEQLESATERLQLVVPLALALVFFFLFLVFRNLRDGLIVFTGIPFALVGGVLALWARDLPFSISAAVGLIALSGVATLNGLVLVGAIRRKLKEQMDLTPAICEGAVERMRPVLITALVASLGFVPMALATGMGAEVQKPLATVVIGGILTSTLLTLIVLPILYQILGGKSGFNRA